MNTLAHNTLPKTMQAARFYSPGDVRYESCDTPQPGAGEIIIAIQAATTCGTDVKAYRRGHPVLLKNFPCPFGHEGAGIVAAVGEGVSKFKPGDRVVSANSAPCSECFYCQREQFNLCEQLDLLNGTYADFLRVPAPIVEKNTWIIPPHVPFEHASLTEPLAVCVRGIEGCKIQPGQHVAVYGLGAIGLFMARLAKAQGAHVTALGRSESKLNLAKAFSLADTILNTQEFESIRELAQAHSPEGRGFDVVIEAIGKPESWSAALDMVRPGGLVNWFGGCPSGSQVSVDTRRMHYEELTLVSFFHHTPSHFKAALDWIASGELALNQLISDTMPMSAVIEALERVEQGRALKIALTPPDRPLGILKEALTAKDTVKL